MKHTKFTKQFSLQKTLRFELKPVGETADYINEYGADYIKVIVQYDIKRADNYQEIKGLIDDLHRSYIDQRLSSSYEALGPPVNIKTGEIVITPDDLNCAFDQYKALKTDPSNKDLQNLWSKQQETMRKKLVVVFSDKAKLFGKDVITKTLPDFLKENGRWDEHRELVESFKRFTTYFTGFNKNRENMYVADDKATSIANRTINENLPKFFSNCIIFKDIQEKHSDFLFSFFGQETLRLLGIENKDLSQAFLPEFYLKLFSQRGIEAYQVLLGGVKRDDGNVDGLNQQINLYRQRKSDLRPRDFPTFASLYKQILAETTSSSFRYQPYENDQDMFDEIKTLMQDLSTEGGHFSCLRDIIQNLENCDTKLVFIRGNALNQLSNDWLGSYALIERALDYYIEESGECRTKALKEKYKKRTNDQGWFSMAEVQSWIDYYLNDHDVEECKVWHNAMQTSGKTLVEYFVLTMNQPFQKEKGGTTPISQSECVVKPLLELQQLDGNRRPPETDDDNAQGSTGFHQVESIQQLLDGYMKILNRFRSLHLVYKRKPMEMPGEQDLGFYNDFSNLFDLMTESVQSVYNKTRNHLSKKPFKTDKVKINFGSPTFLGSFHEDKTGSSRVILLRHGRSFFLAVLNGNVNQILKSLIPAENSNNEFERIIYRQAASPGKDIQNLMVIEGKTVRKTGRKDDDGVNRRLEELKETHLLSNINSIRKRKSYSKASNDFSRCDLIEFIDFYKARANQYFSDFNFVFKESRDYEDFADFTNHINSQAYQLKFSPVSDNAIKVLQDERKLFLFQIYNKDFSPHSKGTPNMHSLYWRGMFEDRNLQDVVLKLNGAAEMFFRKHSIAYKDRTVHEKNKNILRKTKSGEGKFSQFPYDIIKDKRYTQDKLFLHVPTTLNHKATNPNPKRFNDLINRAVTSDTNVIGVDRGERHLLYFCVINPRGEIIDKGSLNIMQQGAQTVNYQEKLTQRQKERDLARKSWTSVENIKELKHGYLSQVVHKLSQLIVEHRAIVCLENLNSGFKRGRFKVEKQVYQKFEKALIDKLNYLVDKQEKDPLKPGHYLNALQLTAPFKSFEKLGNQSGILYYVRADYTSKICPVTGFVNLLRPYYQNIDKSKEYFRKFKEIRYNSASGYFSFEFDYTRTNPQAKLKGCRTHWSVCSHGTRLVNKKDDHGAWQTEVVDPTEKLVEAFGIAGIDYASGDNLIEEIIAQDSSRFFKSLMYGLRLTLQMRNSRSNSTAPEDDYLISPVADEKGNFYDSREAGSDLPKNADANGAYHIALKGLWNIQQITQYDWSVDKARGPNLSMTNEKWFAFTQNKPFKQ